jgi:hypothetical protein
MALGHLGAWDDGLGAWEFGVYYSGKQGICGVCWHWWWGKRWLQNKIYEHAHLHDQIVQVLGHYGGKPKGCWVCWHWWWGKRWLQTKNFEHAHLHDHIVQGWWEFLGMIAG